MPAGASYNPTGVEDVETDLFCTIDGIGNPITVRQVNEYDDATGITEQNYYLVTDVALATPLALSPAQIAALRPGPCKNTPQTGFLRIGGPGAPAGTAPDGTTADFSTLVPAGFALTGWEVIVEAGNSPVQAASANRTEYTPNIGPVRPLANGEGVRAEEDENGNALDNNPLRFECFGSGRAIVHYTIRPV